MSSTNSKKNVACVELYSSFKTLTCSAETRSSKMRYRININLLTTATEGKLFFDATLYLTCFEELLTSYNL